MKAYRKKLVGIILTMLFCFSPVSTFAAEPGVHITSGLNLEAEEVECTFDDVRIVYGEAKPNTKIVFTVSKMNRFGEMVELHKDIVTVGSMGLFSATLPLERGNNHITMKAEGETRKVVVKRVPKTVKMQLQKMIALPGLQVMM